MSANFQPQQCGPRTPAFPYDTTGRTQQLLHQALVRDPSSHSQACRLQREFHGWMGLCQWVGPACSLLPGGSAQMLMNTAPHPSPGRQSSAGASLRGEPLPGFRHLSSSPLGMGKTGHHPQQRSSACLPAERLLLQVRAAWVRSPHIPSPLTSLALIPDLGLKTYRRHERHGQALCFCLSLALSTQDSLSVIGVCVRSTSLVDFSGRCRLGAEADSVSTLL